MWKLLKPAWQGIYRLVCFRNLCCVAIHTHLHRCISVVSLCRRRKAVTALAAAFQLRKRCGSSARRRRCAMIPARYAQPWFVISVDFLNRVEAPAWLHREQCHRVEVGQQSHTRVRRRLACVHMQGCGPQAMRKRTTSKCHADNRMHEATTTAVSVTGSSEQSAPCQGTVMLFRLPHTCYPVYNRIQLESAAISCLPRHFRICQVHDVRDAARADDVVMAEQMASMRIAVAAAVCLVGQRARRQAHDLHVHTTDQPLNASQCCAYAELQP